MEWEFNRTETWTFYIWRMGWKTLSSQVIWRVEDEKDFLNMYKADYVIFEGKIIITTRTTQSRRNSKKFFFIILNWNYWKYVLIYEKAKEERSKQAICWGNKTLCRKTLFCLLDKFFPFFYTHFVLSFPIVSLWINTIVLPLCLPYLV